MKICGGSTQAGWRVVGTIALIALAGIAQANNGSGNGKGAPEGKNNDPSNLPPTISGEPPSLAVEGLRYEFTPEASDPEGYPLSFYISGRPSWASFDRKTGRLSGTPTSADVGTTWSVTIEAADRWNRAALGPFRIVVESSGLTTVPPTNEPPSIAGSPPPTVTAGSTYSFQPSASDPNGDPLAFGIRNKPAWANFNSVNGALTGTPPDSAVGTYSNVEISVSDGVSTASLSPFAIEVMAEPNSPPAISGTPAGSVTAGQAYGFRPNASDADGDTLTFSIRNKPAWASFSASTGALSGTPTDSAVGVHSGIEISVSDGKDTAALPAFSVEVLDKP
ncbi:MAG TPA: putative Ig domain-containing protein, partial [Steroidobacteraceae bacterium]|nr:putative Ig domain-containing protein [Steroidobacteraceae bacterium]